MGRRIVFFASALLLAMPVLTGNLFAKSDSGQKSPNILRIFGYTLCVGEQPAQVRCDWSLPSTVEKKTRAKALNTRHFDLFGYRFCVGEQRQADCDVRLSIASDSMLNWLQSQTPGPRCDTKAPWIPCSVSHYHSLN